MITTAIPLWVQPEKYFSAPPKKDKQKKPQKMRLFMFVIYSGSFSGETIVYTKEK